LWWQNVLLKTDVGFNRKEKMNIHLNLEEGASGDWKLEKFSVSEQQAKFHNMRELFHSHRFINPGNYWRLVYKGEIIMSNTSSEIADHYNFIKKAKGKILIAGLGLGMVVKALLDKDCVSHITIVEKSSDVINLVAPFYKDKRISIINQDIFSFNPKEVYDFAWFDIWTYIMSDNYKDMIRLNRKFGQFAKVKEHWCYNQCKRLYKHDLLN